MRSQKRRSTRRRTLRKKQRGGGQNKTSHKDSTSEVTVIISANKVTPELTILLDSLKRYHYSYEILGMGTEWKGFKARITQYKDAAKAHMEKHGDAALIIFIDGYDVLCVKDSEKVVASYRARARTMPILFGAEIYCLDNCYRDALKWFSHHFGKAHQARIESTLKDVDDCYGCVISDSPTFLNGGFCMGPVKEMYNMYSWMESSGIDDDQVAAGEYTAKHLDKVDLDIDEKIARNKLKTRVRLSDEGTDEGPGFLHYPGMRSKEDRARLVGLYKEY